MISGSVADSKPVFEKILESCQRLFASSEQGVLLVGEDGRLHLGAHHGSARERLRKAVPGRPRPAAATDASDAASIHIKDVSAMPTSLPACAPSPSASTSAPLSQVIAPMMWEGDRSAACT